MLNKVNFLRERLVFDDEKEKEISERGFNLLLQEWQGHTDAKWWVDNRKMTVRDISDSVEKITRSCD